MKRIISLLLILTLCLFNTSIAFAENNNAYLVITAQPEAQVVKEGETVKFTIEADNADSYQWQVNTGKSWVSMTNASVWRGNQSATLQFTASKAYSKYKYRCIVSDGIETIESSEVTFSIPSSLSITAQPEAQVVKEGETVKFTIEADNADSYQWQVNTGKSWVSMTNASGWRGNQSARLQYTANKAYSKYKYRCIVSDGIETIESDEVTFTICEYFNPSDVELTDEGLLSLTITDNTQHTIMLGIYHKEVSLQSVLKKLIKKQNVITNDSLIAVLPIDINGETEYSTNISNFMNASGTYYVVAKAVGSADEENAKDFGIGETVTSNTIYYTRPDSSLSVPQNVTWSNTIYGRAVWDEVEDADSYQVMLYSGDDIIASRNVNTTHFNFSSGWIDFENVAKKDYTFTVTAMSSDITSVSNSVESEHSEKLAAPESMNAVSIVTQPAGRYASLGKKVSVSLSASGLGLTYDWFVDGEKAAEGSDDAIITFTAEKEGEIPVYAVIHDALGNEITSDIATINVIDDSPIASVITRQPEDKTVDAGDSAVRFTVDASAPKNFTKTYQWYKSDDGNHWSKGSTSYYYNVSSAPANDGLRIKCIVNVTAPTGVVVCEETSDVVTLHVNKTPIVIMRDLDDDYYTDGDSYITIQAESTVDQTLTYKWMIDNIELSGANTRTLKISQFENDCEVYCIISDGEETIESNKATIHIGGNPATNIFVQKKEGPSNEHMAVGDVIQLQASLVPEKATSPISWTSSDENVATVVGGQITAKKFGTASITAEANGHSSTYNVTVDSYRVEFDPQGGVFEDGQTANKLVRVVSGEDITLLPISKPDDTFLGWTTDGETVVTNIKAQETTTLYAKWEKSTQEEDKNLEITQDLFENQYARIGENALFEVVTNGAKIKSYQWMINDGNGWKAVNTGVTNDGAKTSLEVEATEGNNGYCYKVVVTPFKGDAVESTVSTLTTGETDIPQQTESFEFVSIPVSVSEIEGETATFYAEVNKENADYQWQCNATGDWENVGTGQTLSVVATQNGVKYRCVVTVGDETKESPEATLTVISKLSIVTDLADTYNQSEDGVGFVVEAEGTDVHYQWEVKEADASDFHEVDGATDHTYAPKLTKTDDGLQVRCHITDGNQSIYSNIATFVWKEQHAENITIERIGDEAIGIDDQVVLKATVTPDNAVDEVVWSCEDAEIESDGNQVTVSINKLGDFNVTATAGEITKTYIITCDHVYVAYDSGDENIDKVKVAAGMFTPDKEVSKEGFTFLGWSLSENGDVVENVELTDNTVLYAVWKAVEDPLEITTDIDSEMTVTEGDQFSLHIDSNKEGASYQWYKIDPDGNEYASVTDKDFNDILAESALNGYKFYCIVSYGEETVRSNTLTLAVEEQSGKVTSVMLYPNNTYFDILMGAGSGSEQWLEISSQVEGNYSDTNELSYYWEESTDYGNTWYEAFNESTEPTILSRLISGGYQSIMYRLTVNGVSSDPVEIQIYEHYDEGCPCGCGMPGCTCGPECPLMGGEG